MRARLYAAVLLLLAALQHGPARAALSIYMSPEDLVRRATLVVEGTVVRTASGLDARSGALATYVTLAVERVHRGPGPDGLEQVVLREPGGRYGELVNELDAVPVYHTGERVLVFLEPAADGALRTAGMFFGKFAVEQADGATEAVRDLEGQGRILGRPAARTERFPLRDLGTLAASTGRPPARPWSPVPEEFARLVWDDVHETSAESAELPGAARGARLAPAPGGTAAASPGPRFVPAEPAAPTRWTQVDNGTPITVNIQQSGNPLGDGAAAVAELERAMAAWSEVSESRVVLAPGNTNLDYTATHSMSPARSYPSTNVILFGDPYGDIADPVDCAGVLAVGGYWRLAAVTSTVNNVGFHPAARLYVVFNNGFECFLSDPDNLAEVAAHELGHGLGLGHSSEPDAIMRAHPYGDRGPRLGDDDRDGAHCMYPHTLKLTSPNGGEVWAAGSWQSIAWSSTPESGPDPGVVDLEVSVDGGSVWSPIASGTPNDGVQSWRVPSTPGTRARVRVVRPPRAGGLASVYPEFCSGDASDGDLTIGAASRTAGGVAAGRRRAGLTAPRH